MFGAQDRAAYERRRVSSLYSKSFQANAGIDDGLPGVPKLGTFRIDLGVVY